jgi:hypothetical protein
MLLWACALLPMAGQPLSFPNCGRCKVCMARLCWLCRVASIPLFVLQQSASFLQYGGCACTASKHPARCVKFVYDWTAALRQVAAHAHGVCAVCIMMMLMSTTTSLANTASSACCVSVMTIPLATLLWPRGCVECFCLAIIVGLLHMAFLVIVGAVLRVLTGSC